MSLYTWLGGPSVNRRHRREPISLYTWLGNGRGGHLYDRIPTGIYPWAAGEPEGRPHYSTEEYDFSTPSRAVSWNVTPPTFIKFNITETYDVQEIKDYVLELLHGSTSEIVDEIAEQVIERMKNNINLTVQEALAETMIAISEPHLDQLIEEAKNE